MTGEALTTESIEAAQSAARAVIRENYPDAAAAAPWR